MKNSSFSKRETILAVDPSTRGLGFVVMDGRRQLVDWGSKDAREGDKNARCLSHVAKLLEIYKPAVVVVEDYAGEGSRRGPRVQSLLNRIAELAALEGIVIHRFSRGQMRQAFAYSGASNKHQIATEIARRLPELLPWLPPPRKIWQSEDERFNIFDAASLALTFFQSAKNQKLAA